jgi:hypothetical protein
MVGGGDFGKAGGITHFIMIEIGAIMTMFQVFILMLIQGGEITTDAMIGMDIRGSMNGFLINDFNRTGKVGIEINIGEVKKLGVLKATNLDYNKRDMG